jgi:hypothetical protein
MRMSCKRWFAESGARPAPALAGSGRNHNGVDLTENDVDAAGDPGHYGASRDRDKPSHQSVLDEILTASVFPDPELSDVLNEL